MAGVWRGCLGEMLIRGRVHAVVRWRYRVAARVFAEQKYDGVLTRHRLGLIVPERTGSASRKVYPPLWNESRTSPVDQSAKEAHSKASLLRTASGC